MRSTWPRHDATDQIPPRFDVALLCPFQVAPPAATATIAVVAAGEAAPVGLDTGITFATSDAEADRDDLLARGVDVDELLRWPGVPAMFAFRDDDGNGLKIIETP
jgi:hypothetical protein